MTQFKQRKATKKRGWEAILRGNVHTNVATDNVIWTFVGGWVKVVDVTNVAMLHFSNCGRLTSMIINEKSVFGEKQDFFLRL